MLPMGGSPGLVVMGDDSSSRGCGFGSRHRILDGHDLFHIDLLFKLYYLFETLATDCKSFVKLLPRSWFSFCFQVS